MATAEQRMRRELAALSNECERACTALERLKVEEGVYGDGKYEVRVCINEVARATRSALAAAGSCPRCGQGGDCPCS